MGDRRTWWRWFVGVGVVAVMVVIAWQLTRPAQYRSFPDAIDADLRAVGIAVQQVELIHQWPDTVNDVNYGANILITLPSGTQHWGRLDCRSWRRDCVYTVAAFDVHLKALPDLVKTAPWNERLWQWLQRLFASV